MKLTSEEKLLISRKDLGVSWPVQIKSQSARIHYRWCSPWCFVCVVFVSLCIIVSASWLRGGPLTVINMELVYFGVNATEPTTEEKVPHCDDGSKLQRFNCHPDSEPNKESCEQRGCCWDDADDKTPGAVDVEYPKCFFPTQYGSYEIDGELQETDFGLTITLSQRDKPPWFKNMASIKVDLYLQSEDVFHFKIYEASNVVGVSADKGRANKPGQTDYLYSVNPKPFGIKVTRKSTNTVLFDTTDTSAPLVFSEQYIQISTVVPSGFLYGLKAHNLSLFSNLTGYDTRTLDNSQFYMSYDSPSGAYGVYTHNKYGIEVDMQPFPALTFRSTGRILEFYIFSGPTPDLVLEQYSNVHQGKSVLPPYWALGAQIKTDTHLGNEQIQQLITKLRKEKFPHDLVWCQDTNLNSSTTAKVDNTPRTKILAGERIGVVLSREQVNKMNIVVNTSHPDSGQFIIECLQSTYNHEDLSGIWLKSYSRNIKTASHLTHNSCVNVTLNSTKRILVTTDTGSSLSGSSQFGDTVFRDTNSSWSVLRNSVADLMNDQMKGAVLSGSSICNVMHGEKSEELCMRWHQLGVFYPLIVIQENVVQHQWSGRVKNIINSALKLRYSLLPYLYTLFYDRHVRGQPIIKPLSFQYLSDRTTLAVEEQFLFGSALLISPALHSNRVIIPCYFPKDVWFDYYTGVHQMETGSWVNLSTPHDTINIHQRGGTIIPTQHSGISATVSRRTPFTLNVALKRGVASGSLFLDDGERKDTLERRNYSYIEFNVKMGVLLSKPVHKSYIPKEGAILEKIRVFGVNQKPSVITVNKKRVQVHFDGDTNVLTITGLHINLLEIIKVQWK